MEAKFRHYRENLSRRGCRLPQEWTEEERSEYRTWVKRTFHRQYVKKIREKAEEGDKKAVAYVAQQKERQEEYDRNRRYRPSQAEDPEEYERRRELARQAEQRYRENHHDRRLETSRKMEAKPERKRRKKDYRKDNPEVFQRGTKKYLTKKRKEPGFHESEVKRVRTAYGFERYYKDAQKRGIETFELTRDQFDALVKQPCHYCHEEPQFDGASGIDRVINDVGYIWANCVSCCAMCNYMKKAYPYAKFIAKCKAIAAAHT